MEGIAVEGFSALIKLAPVIATLVLVIMILLWFIKGLLQDAKDERKLNREVLIDNTAVIAEFKEIVRNAIHHK